MPKVIFIHPDQSRQEHLLKSGQTIMDCALDNNIQGLKAQCGGAAICATCHCYIDSPWLENLPVLSNEEIEMLAFVWQRQPNSRLACQVVMSEELDGISIHLPEKQI